ncbi:type II toxin-antitoxin system HicB family antitoxin [Erwinia pyri]|uniref:Type II toxin-antitoxin system HicB family antitoxin n=1 Tax=Erwinia pyri TaxID=3062598 RepID=A0AA50HLE6_9GAMM|nr:type II toxin-antitoxin system HicB family antitoxin [Erwinia sp. DE2]WLS79113.1 type II toxin-antitoxin system HicB family antitoxin [Erwinia sp. DE2]
MKFPIYLHRAEGGSFSGFVPDIKGCYFAGDTIDDAIADAFNAIDAHLEFQAEKGKDLHEAQDISAHLQNSSCEGGYWAYVEVDLLKYEGKAVKLNITLPQNLLYRIDSYVELNKEYGSRSGFIAALARRELVKSA